MKKLFLATLILGAMSSSAFADSGHGTVTFNGSIIKSPCSIAPGDENVTVPLGQVSDVTLNGGGASAEQPFSIKLSGCSLDGKYKDSTGAEKTYLNTVTVRFNGTEMGSTGYLALDGSSTAKGAGVKLMEVNSDQIKINNNAATQSFVAGANELKFKAALQGVQGTTVTPGEFTAVTNFVLTYN